MIICGLDFETSGLDFEKDRIIEIGAVLWDTERAKPLRIINEFVRVPELKISSKITDITGIAQKDLDDFGIQPILAFTFLNTLLKKADYLMAHNAYGFDKPFYFSELRKLNITPTDTPWIDSLVDIDFPESCKSKSLTMLAAAHEFINPFPHRAFSDALTMLKVAQKYPWDNTIANSQAVRAKVKIIVPKPFGPTGDGGRGKDFAKSIGFHWDGSANIWHKTIRKKDYKKLEKAAHPYKIKIIEDSP